MTHCVALLRYRVWVSVLSRLLLMSETRAYGWSQTKRKKKKSQVWNAPVHNDTEQNEVSLNPSSGSPSVWNYSPWMRNLFKWEISEWSLGTLEAFCLFISTSVALQQEITRGSFTAGSTDRPTDQATRTDWKTPKPVPPLWSPLNSLYLSDFLHFVLHPSRPWRLS